MPVTMDHLPVPEPNVERFKAVLRRAKPDRVPLIELAIAEEVMAAVAGRELAPLPSSPTADELRAHTHDRIGVWHRLGYDYFRLRVGIPFRTARLAAADTAGDADGQRAWVDEHSGVIASREDFEQFDWPTLSDMDFSQAESAVECLPGGMGAIGFSGGVLEWSCELLGLMNFSMMLFDDPDLVRDVVDRVGRTILDAFTRYSEMDHVFAIWLGDDLGFKTATLISPDHLRALILPWHRRCAELAHATGRFFILHTCGQVEAVMPDLVNDVGIDARHSFEDVITPVEQFAGKWGDRIAVLGGVDVDLLSRGTPDEIRTRTTQILEACAPRGGYACGSGNSITNYVPPENYLAMIETVHRFNNRL